MYTYKNTENYILQVISFLSVFFDAAFTIKNRINFVKNFLLSHQIFILVTDLR